MAIRKTGPGKFGFYPNSEYLLASIHNFDIEGSDLKIEHKQFLDDHIIRLVKENWYFVLIGVASRTGSAAFDLALSQRRVEAVKRHIDAGLMQSSLNVSIEGVGKQLATGTSNEDELDRAVRLAGWNQPVKPSPHSWPAGPPTPMPTIGPWIPPEQSGPSQEFFIKMVRGASLGPEIAVGEYQTLLLWDKLHGKACYFHRFGGGGQVPGVPIPISYTQEGPWNRFTTKKPMTLENFDHAAATFTTRGTADVGTSALSIGPQGDFPEISLDPFQTGSTWGMTIQSGTKGVLYMDSQGVFDRKDY